MAENKQVFDFDMFGEITPTGELAVLRNSEAVYNSVRMWLASFRGEILRRPNRGGYLMPWLMRPMTPENTRELKQSLREGLYEDFFPTLKVKNLRVTPDYERESWFIELEAYVPYLKDNILIEEEIRRP